MSMKEHTKVRQLEKRVEEMEEMINRLADRVEILEMTQEPKRGRPKKVANG